MLVDDLTLVKKLGKGAFGEVYLTSKQGTKERYATKKIDKKFASNPRAKKYIDNEIAILKDIDHPNIVKLYDVKETSQYYYLVTEYCNGGDLSGCLEEYQDKHNKPFPEEVVQYLMKQIVSAIRYLHNKTILHRDIKLDNILINYDNEEDKKKQNLLKAKVKMIDFGFARYLEKEKLAYSTLGSPINMDPGILKKLNKVENCTDYGYDEKADIWSLGTICYEMLVGKNAFDAENMKDLLNKVSKGSYSIPTTLSREAASFLIGMLQFDLKKRYTAEKLYRHKFLNKNYNELKRINLKDVKSHVKGSKININANNISQSIIAAFGTGISVIYEDPGEVNDDDFDIQTIKKNIQSEHKDPIIKKPSFKREPSKQIQLNEKALQQEFLKVFELINDDCIYVEPKFIPIIPGDDPTVFDKASDFCDEHF